MTIRIVKKESLARGLRRVALERIDAVVADFKDPGVSDHDRVHRFRKCCKSVRALLRLRTAPLGPQDKALDRQLRDAARLLGRSRDAHVRAATLAELTCEPATSRRRRKDEADEPAVALRQLLDVRRSIECWPAHGWRFEHIAAGYRETYRKCRNAWQASRTHPTDHQFHRFRKWAKYHWYQVCMLELADRPAMQQRGRLLKQLGEALGDAHNLAVLQESLQVELLDQPDLARKIEARKQMLYREAMKLGTKCLRKGPNRMSGELAHAWARWRG